MNEQQIQRYGRQILLREVGGRGQAKLLARPVHVEWASAAASVAVAYLAAGGTRVTLAAGVTLDGFLEGTSVEAFNPEAGPPGPAWLTVRGGPASSPGLQVVLGRDLVWGSCPACVALNCSGQPIEPANEVLAGSLAALIIQRLALDGAEPLGAVQILAGGPFTTIPQRCPQHLE
jgi:hypothetical protein